jgi:trehalose-phosphatase
MQAAKPAIDLDRFFQQLAHATGRVLMLDYDGTLAPFQLHPEQARPYPGVCERLDAIMQDPRTQVVVISGRWTKDLLPLLPLRRQPEIWGSHGWEQLRSDGQYRLSSLDENALQGLVTADEWVKAVEARGARYERKPASLAIHWRGLPANQIADIRRLVLENWMDLGLHQHLVWHDFDGGIELRAPGRHKGDAVKAVLEEHAGACAAYLGDDATDEDAFKAIKGHGLGVLVRATYRPTAAEVWLRPPQELLDFLSRWQAVSEAGA